MNRVELSERLVSMSRGASRRARKASQGSKEGLVLAREMVGLAKELLESRKAGLRG